MDERFNGYDKRFKHVAIWRSINPTQWTVALIEAIYIGKQGSIFRPICSISLSLDHLKSKN